jgi:predicted metalloenzyme YecM
MNKYEQMQEIQNLIMQLEEYKDNSYVYANLVGRMSAMFTDEQMDKLYLSVLDEVETKNLEIDLSYERMAGK